MADSNDGADTEAGTYPLLGRKVENSAHASSSLASRAVVETPPIRIMRAAAPIAMTTDWLGHEMSPDFKTSTIARLKKTKRVTSGPLNFTTDTSRVESARATLAAFAGFGIEVSAGQSESTLVAVYRATEISRIEGLELTDRTRVVAGRAAYVPIRIYYGWSLHVVAKSTSSAFSAEAAGSILGVSARARTQAQFWGADVHVDLRGLVARAADDEIVIPRGIEDIEKTFRVDRTRPQPIYVEYMAVDNPDDPLVAWPSFVPPHIERFDDASEYRFYRDPRTPPGKLRVTLMNRHAHDGVVFQAFPKLADRDEGNRFEWRAGGGETRVGEVDVPTWPIKLEWVGHHTHPANVVADAETGWSVDFWRNW